VTTWAFWWDDVNVEHIAEHGVEPYEAEEVIDNRQLLLRAREEKYIAYGQTDAGRYLNEMTQDDKLPDFQTDDELAAWLDSHDTSFLMDTLEQANEALEVVRTKFGTKDLDVRLKTEYVEAIEELAERRGLPYQALVQRWLLEKLNQEAPDLVTK